MNRLLVFNLFKRRLALFIRHRGRNWGEGGVPKGAGMIGVSRGIEYPLLQEILHTVRET